MNVASRRPGARRLVAPTSARAVKRSGTPPALAPALALALALAPALLAGCLRVGPGEDLHLVCEEKTASPRKAYDVGFLVAHTTVEGELADMERVAILEAVRHHVIAPGGRPHFDFAATLAPATLPDGLDAWVFDALAGNDASRPPDVYRVYAWKAGAAWVASAQPGVEGVFRPPASIAQPAWDVANASPEVRGALPNGSYEAGATWEPGLPSCVRLRYENAAGETLHVVVNVVQSRVVLIDRASG